jgi:hypothetical protein
MYDKCTNEFAPKFASKRAPEPPRCISCARPMQLFRRTSRFGGLPDLYSFYCLACDEWHVEEADVAAERLPDHGAVSPA